MCFIDILGNLVPCTLSSKDEYRGTIPALLFTSRWSRCSLFRIWKIQTSPRSCSGILLATPSQREIPRSSVVPKRSRKDLHGIRPKFREIVMQCHYVIVPIVITFFICLLPRTVCAANLIAILSCSGLLRDRWQSWRVGQSWGVRQSDVSLNML